jgi:hypothetical protein
MDILPTDGLLRDLAYPDETEQQQQELSADNGQLPLVHEPDRERADEERLALALEYLGGRSVRDRGFDLAYVEEEIQRTAKRVEPLLEAWRELHRYERLARLSRSGITPTRSNGTSGELKAAVSDLQADARDTATALRDRVKEMAWEHGADVARLEILRGWWRKVSEDSPKVEPSPESGPAPGDEES